MIQNWTKHSCDFEETEAGGEMQEFFKEGLAQAGFAWDMQEIIFNSLI